MAPMRSEPAESTTIVVPTYNEAGNIERLLPQILELSPEMKCLIVDDSSPDGTADRVRELQPKYPDRIKLIVREGRRGGRASAGVLGLRTAVEDGALLIAEMDADFSHDPKYLLTFRDEIRDSDVVLGSRFVPGGQDADRSAFRTQVTVVSSMVYRALLGISVRDVGSGFKMYRRHVLEALPWDEFISSGIAVSMEEIFRICRLGFRVKEVPIVFVDRRVGESKLKASDFIEPLMVSVQLVRSLGRGTSR